MTQSIQYLLESGSFQQVLDTLRHRMAVSIQYLLESGSFRPELSIECLTADPQTAGDRHHARLVGVQEGHQQALNSSSCGFGILQISEQRVGMVTENGEGIT